MKCRSIALKISPLVVYLVAILSITLAQPGNDKVEEFGRNYLNSDFEQGEDDDITGDKAATITCQCGKSNNNKKIVNGIQSNNHAWPWMAAIVTLSVDGLAPQAICGGSIITNRHILTAAHCIPLLMEEGIQNFRIYVGDNKIDGGNASTQKIIKIQSARQHPKYNKTSFDFDAGIIRLSSPLTFNQNILPVCLEQSGKPFINRSAIVAGWGYTTFGGQGVNQLRETKVTIIGNQNCSKSFSQQRPITSTMLCAFYPDTGSCQGDSGGPLFLNRTASINIYRQVGIVSFGIGCADNRYPEVYTRVQRVRSWIAAVTKSGSYCNKM